MKNMDIHWQTKYYPHLTDEQREQAMLEIDKLRKAVAEKKNPLSQLILRDKENS